MRCCRDCWSPTIRRNRLGWYRRKSCRWWHGRSVTCEGGQSPLPLPRRLQGGQDRVRNGGGRHLRSRDAAGSAVPAGMRATCDAACARRELGGGIGASGRLVVSLPQECAGLHSPHCRLPHVAWRAMTACRLHGSGVRNRQPLCARAARGDRRNRRACAEHPVPIRRIHPKMRRCKRAIAGPASTRSTMPQGLDISANTRWTVVVVDVSSVCCQPF